MFIIRENEYNDCGEIIESQVIKTVATESEAMQIKKEKEEQFIIYDIDNHYIEIEKQDDDKTQQYKAAYISWAITSIELSNIIETLYKQSQQVDDIGMMKQIIAAAHEGKKSIVTDGSLIQITQAINKMKIM